MQSEVVIPLGYVDRGCDRMFVEFMERCLVGNGRTGRAFVLIGACLNLKVLLVLGVICGRKSSWRAVRMHYNNNADGDCAFMFVECVERYCVGPGRTDGAFVLELCYWCQMCYEVVILP